MKNKIILSLSGLALMTMLGAGAITTVHADDNSASQSSVVSSSSSDNGSSSSSSTTDVQNKQLSKPYVVIGSGASQDSSTLSKLNSTLGVTDSYKTETVNGQDANTYLKIAGVSDTAMISSVAIAPAEPGSGTLVNIKQFNGQNVITKVTSQQYAMAATMAGVKDVIITVSANSQVSGESALAGVYKALATDGIALNGQNTEAANGLMSATQTAQSELPSNQSGKLASAVTKTAADVASDKQDGQSVNAGTVEKQLNNNLKDVGITGLSQNATGNIVNSLVTFSNSPISMSGSFVKNANKEANTLKKSTGDVMAKAKDFANSEDVQQAKKEAKGLWHKITTFFSNLFS